MDAEEIKKAQDLFDLLDKNNSESLNIKELGKALRGMGLAPSEQHVKEFMDKSEKDPNNCISLEEFRKIYKECKAVSSFSNEEVIQQIRRLDPRNTGHILASDLRELLITGEEPLTPYEADLIISDFCTESSETINLNSFIEALLSNK
jgi:Ca2+-binding EF-hand superfamily protein